MTHESLHVAVVDIGKLSNLGWVIEGPSVEESGTDIDEFVTSLVRATEYGPLALGFEAPMFVPYGRGRGDLDRARSGEGNRAFSASPGACALTKGLVIVPYILQELRARTKNVKPTFKWRNDLAKRDLLFFEAFVTHMGKSETHVQCARAALMQFPKRLEERADLGSAIGEAVTMNLLGAMLLRMGWTDDITVLSEPCLVVRHRGTLN